MLHRFRPSTYCSDTIDDFYPPNLCILNILQGKLFLSYNSMIRIIRDAINTAVEGLFFLGLLTPWQRADGVTCLPPELFILSPNCFCNICPQITDLVSCFISILSILSEFYLNADVANTLLISHRARHLDLTFKTLLTPSIFSSSVLKNICFYEVLELNFVLWLRKNTTEKTFRLKFNSPCFERRAPKVAWNVSESASRFYKNDIFNYGHFIYDVMYNVFDYLYSEVKNEF